MHHIPKADILIIDDDEHNRVALEALLDGLGQNIVTAASGDEALKRLLKQEFAVILLDVRMPDIDGFETATLIRQREKSWTTPIIFITGVDISEEQVARGYSLGAVDYMIKPITSEILCSKVSVFVQLFKKTEEIRQQEKLLRQLQQKEYEQKLVEQKQQLELAFLRKENEKEKKLVEELASKSTELSRFNEELKQFSHIVAHDLQEPLRMVVNYLQLLTRRYQGKLDLDMDRFIGFAVEGAKRMQAMIRDLLSFVSIENRIPHFKLTDCEAVFSQVIANLEVSIAESGAIITHTPLPVVMSDETQMLRLLQNLMSNAIKFRTKDEPLYISVQAVEREKEWLFAVKDNGIGIAPDYYERIFQMSQRLHTRNEYSGTGIGLAICKKITDNHGTRLWVESEPGEGATFYFTIKK